MRTDGRRQELEPEFSGQALKYLAKLEQKTFDVMEKAINEIPAGSIKPLKGGDSLLRLDIYINKVWYRIIFEWISNNQIYIAKVKPRGDAYKGGF